MEMPPTMLTKQEIQHALQVCDAVSLQNWVAFFRLYDAAPNMGQYLMDHMAQKVRFAALKTLAKGCVSVCFS
jgi:hypothetical protein